jgi:hypothetical protein
MRIGVNIPDELLKRIEPLRPFTNISKICKEAITKYAESYEKARVHAEENGAQEIAERICEKQKPIIVDWEVLGLEDAKSWAQLASIESWEDIFNRLDVFERQGRSPFESQFPIPKVEGVKEYHEHSHELDGDNGWFDQQIQLNENVNPYVSSRLDYQKGFISYIMVIRQMIREKASQDLKKRVSELENRKSELRTKIEIPEQMAKEY